MFYLDIKCSSTRTSLVVQWLRICLPMQGTSEDPTWCGATGSMHQNCQALKPRACALQQEKPPHWKAWPPQRRIAPLLAAAIKSPSTGMKAQHSQKKKNPIKKKCPSTSRLSLTLSSQTAVCLEDLFEKQICICYPST